MAYKVFTPEEVQEVLTQAFERAKRLYKHSSFDRAMTALNTALDKKSQAPINKLVENGYAEAIVYVVDGVMTALAEAMEKEVNFNYSIYNMTRYRADYDSIAELQEFFKSTEAIFKIYAHCLDVKEGRKSIPFIVQKFCIENMNILFQFPHRKTTQADSISFIRPDDLIRNRVTVQKPGKWFMANSLGIEKEALEFSTLWVATAEKPPVVFFLSELQDKGGLSENNWEWVYGATSAATGSCMIKCPEVARVYADNPVLDMAYITDSGEPFKGTVIARSIVRRDNNTYIRTYQNNHKTGALFTGFLADKGFKENRNLKGVTLKKLIDPKRSDHLIFPYIDGTSQVAITSSKSKELFEVVSNVPSGKERRKIEVYHGTSAGRVQKQHECTHCSSFGNQQDRGYVKKDGKKQMITFCHHCSPSFIYSRSDHKRYSVTDFKFIWVIDSNGSQFEQTDDAEKYSEITCPDTLRENSNFENIQKVEDKDGNNLIKNKDFSFMLDLLPRTRNPVTLYNGKVTDANQATTFSSQFFKGVDAELVKKLKYYSPYDRAAKKIREEIYYSNEKTGKKKLFAFFLKQGAIDQATHDVCVQIQTVPALTISLSDGSSSVSRTHDVDAGELVYTFSLSEEIKEKLWKPILSETEKLKKDLEDLFAELKAIDMVVL